MRELIELLIAFLAGMIITKLYIEIKEFKRRGRVERLRKKKDLL